MTNAETTSTTSETSNPKKTSVPRHYKYATVVENTIARMRSPKSGAWKSMNAFLTACIADETDVARAAELTEAREALAVAAAELETAANILKALPENYGARKTVRKASIEAGMTCRIANKYRDGYAGILDDLDSLEVCRVSDKMVKIKTTEGEMLTVRRAHLTAKPLGDDEATAE